MGIYSTIDCSDMNWSRKDILLSKNGKGELFMFENEMKIIVQIFFPADF